MTRRNAPPNPIFAQSPELSNLRAPAAHSEPRRKKRAQQTPGAVLSEIRSLLGKGRYRAAQKLAQTAAERFSEHPDLRRMNRALNERKAEQHPASGRDTTEEFRWLQNPPNSARGKWVALVGSDVVAAAEDPTDLVESLKSKELAASPLVVRVA